MVVERQSQRYFRGLDLDELDLDQAYVNVTNSLPNVPNLFIYVLNEECYRCPFQYHANVSLITN